MTRKRAVSAAQMWTDLDWLDPYPAGRLLHHATIDPYGDPDDTHWTGVRLDCGIVADVAIPGVTTRMSARRCGPCCDINGLPRGQGSPKNDDACRTVLGTKEPS